MCLHAQCDHSERLLGAAASAIAAGQRARSMERDLAETAVRMCQVLTAVVRKSTVVLARGLCTAVSRLGCRGTDGKSSGGALTARPMFRAAGREELGS